MLDVGTVPPLCFGHKRIIGVKYRLSITFEMVQPRLNHVFGVVSRSLGFFAPKSRRGGLLRILYLLMHWKRKTAKGDQNNNMGKQLKTQGPVSLLLTNSHQKRTTT